MNRAPDFDVERRVDQAWGMMAVAVGMVRHGWGYERLMFSPPSSPGQDPWFAVIAHLARSPSGKSITVVARGDNCGQCDFTETTNIVNWVATALATIQQGLIVTDADLTVVTLAFTRPGADIDSVLTRLQEEFGKNGRHPSSIPIIVSWVDEGTNQIWWDCIGTDEACGTVDPNDAALIACNQQNRPAGCGAKEWELDYYPPGMNGGDQIGADPPPPQGSQCVSGTVCLTPEGVQSYSEHAR